MYLQFPLLSPTQLQNTGGHEWQSGVEFGLTGDRLVRPLHSPLTVLHSTPGVSTTSSVITLKKAVNYRIVGNFQGRKIFVNGWKIRSLWRKLSQIAH